MIKVLHVRSTTGFYGAEKVIANLLPEINHQSVEVEAELFSIEGDGDDSKRLASALIDADVHVTRWSNPGKISFRLMKCLRRDIKQNKFTIIHTHDYKSLVHARLATLGLSVDVIHHMHGGLNTTKAEKLYAFIERFFINFVSLVFVVSRDISPKVFREPRYKINYLSNGVSLPRNAGEKDNGFPHSEVFSLLMVARMSAEKNHFLAIETISQLKSRGCKVKLMMVGDGPLLQDIKKMIIDKGLENEVVLAGYVSNPNELYQKADVLIISSKTEGLPMNLLEALSFGVPVVSTAVGEVPHVLSNGPCGLIAEANAKDFSGKIFELIANGEMLGDMRAAAKKVIQTKYSISAQAENVIESYKQVSLAV